MKKRSTVRSRWGLNDDDNFVAIPEAVLDILAARDVTHFEQVVFMHLLRSWRWSGGDDALVSMVAIATSMRSNRRNVRRALLGLADKGIITYGVNGPGCRPGVSIARVKNLIHKPSLWRWKRPPQPASTRSRILRQSDPGDLRQSDPGNLSHARLKSVDPECPESMQTEEAGSAAGVGEAPSAAPAGYAEFKAELKRKGFRL